MDKRLQPGTIRDHGLRRLPGGILLAAACMMCTGGCEQGGTDGPGGFVDPDVAIVQTSPEDGATEVSIDMAVTLTFAQAVDPDSLDGWLDPEVDVDLIWSAGNTVLTAIPNAPLSPATRYTVSIGDLTLADGSALASQFDFEFTTAGDTDGPGTDEETQPLPLDEVRFWGYQIQGVDADGAIDALAESRYDMLVVEPTRTDAEMLTFDTKGMVDRLKATKAHDGVHRKLVIAYVDIGEAEDWRWYWTWSKEPEDVQVPEDTDLPDDWPDYIVARDPDGWVGNYPVAYWDEEWKDIMIYGETREPAGDRDFTSAVDELILDGFDGIYLDWVEGFENVHVIASAEAAGLDPAEEMISFIGEIREYARGRNPDFLVIQQNAAALIDGRPNLLNHIDGIAQEGVWYDGSATDDWDELEGYWETESQLTDEYVGFLDEYLAGGVPVFVCEYALQNNADEAYQRATAEGYVPYVTRRSLGRLTDTPPPGYEGSTDDDTGDDDCTPIECPFVSSAAEMAVLCTTPVPCSTNVSTTDSITAEFTQPFDLNDLGADILSETGQSFDVAVSQSPDGKTLIATPVDPLLDNHTYALVIDYVGDQQGNRTQIDGFYCFSTGSQLNCPSRPECQDHDATDGGVMAWAEYDYTRPFGADSFWNTPIDASPEIDPNSQALIAGFTNVFEAQGGIYLGVRQDAVPVYIASADTPRVTVTLTDVFASLTEIADVPLPVEALPDCGFDTLLAAYDPGTAVFYEFWRAVKKDDGSWQATTGNSTDASSGSGVYPGDGATSAAIRASGFSLLGGMIWPHELEAGVIDHAIAFIYFPTRSGGPVAPAVASDGAVDDPSALPMGVHLQLDPGLDLDALGLEPWERAIGRCLQEYGMYLSDTGGGIGLSMLHTYSFQGNPYEGLLPEEAITDGGVFLTGLPPESFRVLSPPPG